MLSFYNDILQSVDTDKITVPDFEETKKHNPTKPKPPREIFEASLMKIQDLAMLIKLVQWQFQEHWNLLNDFEIRLDLGDGGEFMLQKNPPELVQQRIENALKNTKKKTFSVRSNIEFWTKNDYANVDRYQEIHGKFFQPL